MSPENGGLPHHERPRANGNGNGHVPRMPMDVPPVWAARLRLLDRTATRFGTVAGVILRRFLLTSHMSLEDLEHAAHRSWRELRDEWPTGAPSGAEETPGRRHHVVPHAGGGWAVKAEGEDGPRLTFQRREDALDAAFRLARLEDAAVVTHRNDGTIEGVARPPR